MLPLGPRALGISDELGDKVGRADNIGVAESGPDIPQQFHADGAILLLARKQASSPARVLRPGAAHEISDRQKRAPIVGRAVVQVGHLRIWIGQLVEVIGRPTSRLTAQGSKVRVVPATQALDLRSGRFSLKPHNDGPVLEGIGKIANRGDRLRRPGREPARFVIDVADHVGGGFCPIFCGRH